MTTTPEDTRPEGPSTSAARRRPRRPGSTTPGGGRTRGRAPRPAGEDLVANLTEMVDRLIKENRELKRAIASAEKTVAGAGLAQATKMLSDRKSTRLNSSHLGISYAVFCLKKKRTGWLARRVRSTPRD